MDRIRKKNRKFLTIILILACTVVGLYGCGETDDEFVADQTGEPMNVFGEFTTTDLDGNEATQEIFSESKLTMVNVWATFCGPCIKEMPELAMINEKYKDKDFQIVGMVVDVLDNNGEISEAAVEEARAIVEDTSADYFHLLPCEDLLVGKLAEVTSLPTTIFVDEAGNQVGKEYIGSKSKKDWEKIIDGLLELQEND